MVRAKKGNTEISKVGGWMKKHSDAILVVVIRHANVFVCRITHLLWPELLNVCMLSVIM